MSPRNFCSHCGNLLTPGAAFCGECGATVPLSNVQQEPELSSSQEKPTERNATVNASKDVVVSMPSQDASTERNASNASSNTIPKSSGCSVKVILIALACFICLWLVGTVLDVLLHSNKSSSNESSDSSTNKPRRSFAEIQQGAKNDCVKFPKIDASYDDCVSITVGNELYLGNNNIVPPSCEPLTGMARTDCQVCGGYQPCIAASERQQQNYDIQKMSDQIDHSAEIQKQAEQDRLRQEGLIH